MADGTLPHFAQLAQEGVHAEYAQTIDPSLTAAAHNSISTGSYPARTGIVSNAFHNSNDSFYWYRTGFDEPLDKAEPVWVTASKAGLTTASVFFVGGSPSLPGQMADYTIGYGIRDAYSLQEKVSLSSGESWPGAPESFSPVLEGSFQIPEVARVYLLVLDSSDDQTVNYDTVLLSPSTADQPRQVSQDTPQMKVGDWAPVVLLPHVYAGADFLIQKISSDSVTLFYSNVYHNNASPRKLQEALNQKFGFFRSGADSYAMEHGWITPEENMHLLESGSRWMAEVAAWVYTSYHPDLLFTWQDDFDAAGHAFFMVDPRQTDYSPEKAAQYAEFYKEAAQTADQALAIMLEPLDLTNTTVMMVADHGMAPIHTNVYVNTVLEQAGLLTLDNRNYVVEEKSKAFAVASGGAVNVYINLEGREKHGIVSQEEYGQVQSEVVDLLTNLVDPESGEAVFERVLTHDQLGPLGLDHPNSGDVFAQANLGYALDGYRGVDQIFEPASYYGQHGYDSTLPEMHAIFIAAGRGVPDTGETIPPVSVLDYAPTIAALLGFSPAATVDGAPIPSIAGR